MSEEYQKDIKKLLEIIVSATPEQKDKIISQLDEKTLYALRVESAKFIKTPVYGEGKQRILAFNYSNQREKYQKRFAMTSLIGFIFRMAEEWNPNESENVNLTSENDSVFSDLFTSKEKKFKTNRPLEIILQNLESLRNEISDDLETSRKAEIYHNIFLEQYKYNRYLQTGAYKEKELMENEINKKTIDFDKQKVQCENERKRLEIVERKVELRKNFDNSEMETTDAVFEELDVYLTDPQKTKLSTFDKLQPLEVLEKQRDNTQNSLLKQEDLVHIKNSELEDLKNKINVEAEKIKKAKARIQTIQKKYKTTFSREFEEFAVPAYELTDTEYENIIQEVKSELKIDETLEEYQDRHRSIVLKFLMEFLRYNPDNHVQCAYKPNYDDESRQPLITAWKKFYSGEIPETEYTTALEKYNQDNTTMRVVAEEKHARSLIPPDDTFFRWDRYTENNYEELRQATDDIYAEKSDIETSIVPLEVFENEDSTKLKLQIEEWQRKYADEFEGDVYQATFNQNNLIGSWTENRERRDFYTKNSEIIKRIIKQNEDDNKMGRRLMQKRTQKNNKKEDPAFKAYREANESGLKTGGAKPANELENRSSINVDYNELSSMNTPDESTNDEVEVKYTHLRSRRRGRRVVADSNQGKFHIEADKTGESKGYIMKPKDMHKHLSAQDMKSFMSEMQ